MRSYEIGIDPRNVRVVCVHSNTDPLSGTYGSLLRAGVEWIQRENDVAPFGAILGRFLLDDDVTTWIAAPIDADVEARLDVLEAGLGGGAAVASGTFLFSGGDVTYDSALIFTVAPAIYYIDGALFSTPGGQVTLDTADGTFPRKDLIILDASGPNFITGTAAASPAEPVPDATSEIRLSAVDVAAGATTIAVTTIDLYAEHTEWTYSDNSGTLDPDSVSNPRSGTKDIEATSAIAGNRFELTKPASGTEDLSLQKTLRFPIRSKASWPAKKSLRLTWFQTGAQRGSSITIKQGTYGFDTGLTTGYQVLAIPVADFGIPVGQLVTTLRVEVAGSVSTIGFHVDDIALQATSAVTGPGGVSGVSSFNGRAGAVIPASGDYATAQITGLSALLALLAPLASPPLTGTPTAPTVGGTSDSTTKLATTAFVQAVVAAAIATLIGTAGSTLDTLGEISDAINDDANLYTTLVALIGGKASIYTGAGSPEGTQAATAPAFYVQSDAAAGEALWYKLTGSGNTGWENVSGGGGGASALDDLTDVAITAAANGQAIIRRAGTFVNDVIAQADVTNLVSDLAAKASTTYVDGKVAGLSWKQAVRVATAAAGTLASSFENGDTVDGVVLATGDRILIKDQASGAENGIYTVNASGAPTRATDADTGAEMLQATVYVQEGTANADTEWTCTTNAAITLGSTSLTFSQRGSGGTGAPATADYLVKTADGGLSAERVVTDTTTIEVDWATAGQAKFKLVTDTPLPGSPTTTTQAGTDNSTKVATTAQVQAAIAVQPEVLIVAVSDEATALTTGTAKITFRMPFRMTLTSVRASLSTSSSSGNPAIDVNEGGVSIFSTTLTIDSGEKTSQTAATAAVLSDTDLADDAEMTVDIDTAGTGAKGLKLYFIGTRHA